MFYRTTTTTAAMLLLTFCCFAQVPEKSPAKAEQDELRKSAVAFLRETSAEVTTLRSLENRVSFAAEMAGLMWFSDEREATVMYQSVMTDFKQLLMEYDASFNALAITNDDSDNKSSAMYTDDARMGLMMKIRKAIGVRQQIAMSMAEHDPNLAYSFYYDTLGQVTNADFRKQMEDRDGYFETQLLSRIAEKDPAKALQFGKRSIEKGINWSHLELLRKIYAKDEAKGAEFATEIVKRFKADKKSPNSLIYIANFIEIGSANAEPTKDGKKRERMFTDDQLRELADMLADWFLAQPELESYQMGRLALIEKYAPERMAQINAKFARTKKDTGSGIVAPVVPRMMSTPVPVGLGSGRGQGNTNSSENEKLKQEAEVMKNVQDLGKKEFPKEERQKIVDQARKIIGRIGNKQQKIVGLSMLAGQAAKAGDKELAEDIMKEAQTLVSVSPRNYRDFMELWMLATGFSTTDPEKAFPMLEDTILRLNETIGAFAKVAEFIDVSGEIVDDGEFQVGSFGGSMISGLTRDLGIAGNTLQNLAVADFEKTKALTNRFDRTEVRILAKMMILRSVLGKTDVRNEKLEDGPLMTEIAVPEN